MNRFLSTRGKDGPNHKRDKSRDKSSEKKTQPNANEGFINNIFKPDTSKKAEKVDKETSSPLAEVKERLKTYGLPEIDDVQINYGLNSKHAKGDVNKAVEFLVLFQESVDGIVKPYNASVVMKGAENRGAVTCYLDSLLFAMFARLGSFEPILYTTFLDAPRRRLSTLVRLWVNMLRTGMLIRTDVNALSDCGWKEAALCEQQDTSEAFSFLTETLRLPLLTLKMDIFHTGDEDDEDDHKYIHERLLEVAVPDESTDSQEIKLEDCLESYFNNRIEVKRHLARSNTLSSIHSGIEVTSASKEKGSSTHIEVSELAWSTPSTPTSQSTPCTPITPGGRLRAPSIIRHRVIESLDTKEEGTEIQGSAQSVRKGSIRKEVMMPAWQFFNLIPWYTKRQSSESDIDASIAARFAQDQPVLGICLKRYGMREDCTPFRKNTYIDIPLDIRLPHFIQDETVNGDEPVMSDFKLSLQSVICHRGNSVNAGHYISFIRVRSQVPDGDIESDQRLSDTDKPPNYSTETWLKFDDLSPQRVVPVDISRALKDEMPYLLFYQIQPAIGCSPPPGLAPPSYTDSAIDMEMHGHRPTPMSTGLPGTPEARALNGTANHADLSMQTDGASPTSSGPPAPASSRASYFEGTATPRISIDIERLSGPRESDNASIEARRGSVALTDTSLNSVASGIAIRTAPPTPTEDPTSPETTGQRLSRAAQIFGKTSKSRPTSSSGENRISSTFVRKLNMMKSTSQLNKQEIGRDLTITTDGAADARVSIDESSLRPAEENGGLGRSKSKKGKSRSKSRGSSEKEGDEHHHHHHSRSHSRSSKAKGKEKEKDDKKEGKEKDVPDRECIVM